MKKFVRPGSQRLQLLGSVLGFLVIASASATAKSVPPPVFVKTLNEQPFSTHLEALGTLRANEAVTLSATVTETVRAIHFDDGQLVNANDILVEMTDREENALLQEARATLDEAEKQYERVKSMVDAKLANRASLDERLQLLESARARWQATRSRLEDRLIIAPFTGVVGMRDLSVGALVRPGDVITTLDDISSMKLDMTLPAVYLDLIRPGMPVIAATAGQRSLQIEGAVTSISPRIDPATRSFRVRAQLPNPEGELRPGMLMAVRLTTLEAPRLLLPEEAVVQEGFKKFVYVIDPLTQPVRVIKREVVTGARLAGSVVVLGGVEAGDRVVTHGTMHLKDGAEVVINAEDDGRTLSELLDSAPDAAAIP